MIWLLLLLMLLCPVSSQAAAIGHAYAEQLSNQTTTSTSFQTCATLAGSNMTNGKKYLLMVTGQMQAPAADQSEVRVVRGGTPTLMTGSQSWVGNTSFSTRIPYAYMTVWTAGTNEDVSLQYRTRTTGTSECNFGTLFTMNLSDNLTENTDWHFNENTSSTGLTTTYAGFATVTFTPTAANHDWLVCASAMLDSGAQATNTVLARINGGGDTVPELNLDIQNSGRDEAQYFACRVYTLAASSQTFTLQASVSASTTGTHQSSRIFALDLNKFSQHTFAYTAAEAALSASDYATQVQTASITPTVAGDVWMGFYWTFDNKNSARNNKQRLQVDDSDVPAGQTSAAYTMKFGNAQGLEPQMLSTLVANMTAAAHTIDADASTDSTTGAPAAQERTIWAVTMELASTRRPIQPMVFP